MYSQCSRALCLMCALLVSAGAAATPPATVAAPASQPASVFPELTTQGLIERAKQSYHLVTDRLMTRADLAADDREFLRDATDKFDAAVKDALTNLPPDVAGGFRKTTDLLTAAQRPLESRRHLKLLIDQESHALSNLTSVMSSTDNFMKTYKASGASEKAQAAADKALKDLQAELAAVQVEADKAEKAAANPALNANADSSILLLRHMDAHSQCLYRCTVALQTTLAADDLERLYIALILHDGLGSYYLTFSTAGAGVPTPIAGTYELRQIAAGDRKTLATLTLPKGTSLSFTKTSAHAGDKQFPLDEGLFAWVLTKQ